MPAGLDKDILGQALYDVRAIYSNKTNDQLVTTYGTIEAARLHAAKAEANAIIEHIKSNMKLTVPGTGLTVGATAVTGSSVTGSAS